MRLMMIGLSKREKADGWYQLVSWMDADRHGNVADDVSETTFPSLRGWRSRFLTPGTLVYCDFFRFIQRQCRSCTSGRLHYYSRLTLVPFHTFDLFPPAASGCYY